MKKNSNRLTVLVAGDFILDRFLWGNCDRISPEAPVQVVDVKREEKTLGGAGNVINNLHALACGAVPVGVLGEDDRAEIVISLLEERGINTDLIIRNGKRSTSEKTRVIASHQQVVRFDMETREPIDRETESELLKTLPEVIAAADAVILSDYGKGVLTHRISLSIIDEANKNGIPTICDPKGRDYAKYRNATIATPNKREASEASGIDIIDTRTLYQAGRTILDSYGFTHVLITLSDEGMALFTGDRMVHLPTIAQEVFDVSGAGDTVVAAIAYALAGGQDIEDACHFANTAAGIVVGKVGTATVTLCEIDQHMGELEEKGIHGVKKKIVSREELKSLLDSVRGEGKKIVFTNGCFDILHAGHIQVLEEAAMEGDCLVIGLNSDASVRRLKGQERPVVSEYDRAHILSALEFVDWVVVFEEDTPYNLIDLLKPDVIVKGGDYTEDEVVGADIVKANRGKVKIIPLVQGKSTTSTISRIMELKK